jgi:hypothetical protein
MAIDALAAKRRKDRARLQSPAVDRDTVERTVLSDQTPLSAAGKRGK